MSIQWDESLSIGVADLDQQHQEFFARFNSLSEACQEGRGSEVIRELLDKLIEYTDLHFSTEEALLERLKHPNLKVQREQHSIFRQQISALREKYYQDAPKRELAASVNGILVRWLIQHIRKVDKGIAACAPSLSP